MAYERIDESEKFDGPTRDSHELRYRIASGFVRYGDTVLDAGCGVGYGERILTKEETIREGEPIATWIGIDKNPANENTKKYDFETGEGELPNRFNVFVGLEIIEHLNNDGVRNFVEIAKKAEDWIIVSTPIIPNSNPYHKQQFKEQDILDLFVDNEWEIYGSLKQNEGTYGIYTFSKKRT